MTRRIYLYFAVTVILGAILGGVGVYYYLWHSGRLQHPSGFNKARALAHLKKELNLTDAQSQQISQIFDETSQKVRDLQKQIDPQVHALHMETRSRIRQILNPDQAKKFDEHVRQIDERRRLRGSMPPPSASPPH
jgi:Spy/CpxP family protein refolding chaperone